VEWLYKAFKRFLDKRAREIRAVIYARVSSHGQKEEGKLDRQIEKLRSYCSARGYRVVDVITDVASGLKEDRSGLQKLFDIVEKRQADVVVVEFKNRLTRFGFEYLKRYFESHGARVEVVEETEGEYAEELVEDVVSTALYFIARVLLPPLAGVQRDRKVVEEVTSNGS